MFLFALVDVSDNFTYVLSGYQGRLSDGRVLENTSFAKSLSKEMLKIHLFQEDNNLYHMFL